MNQRRGAFRSFLETSYVDDAPFRARLTFLEECLSRYSPIISGLVALNGEVGFVTKELSRTNSSQAYHLEDVPDTEMSQIEHIVAVGLAMGFHPSSIFANFLYECLGKEPDLRNPRGIYNFKGLDVARLLELSLEGMVTRQGPDIPNLKDVSTGVVSAIIKKRSELSQLKIRNAVLEEVVTQNKEDTHKKGYFSMKYERDGVFEGHIVAVPLDRSTFCVFRYTDQFNQRGHISFFSCSEDGEYHKIIKSVSDEVLESYGKAIADSGVFELADGELTYFGNKFEARHNVGMIHTPLNQLQDENGQEIEQSRLEEIIRKYI